MQRNKSYFIVNEKNKAYQGFINDLIKREVKVELTLKGLRTVNGLKAKELGALIGVSESTITRRESGKLLPNVLQVKQLAKALNVSVVAILNLWKE